MVLFSSPLSLVHSQECPEWFYCAQIWFVQWLPFWQIDSDLSQSAVDWIVVSTYPKWKDQWKHTPYLIVCTKILCDDKVESPVILLLHGTVQMCTVIPWGLLFPSDSNPREVAQLDATIGAMRGEHSSIQLLKPVGKVLLRAFGRNKAELRQYCLIFECTMLDFQCDWLCELAGCCDPEDRTEKIWILRKLKLPREAHSDVDPAFSHTGWKVVFGKMKTNSIFPPVEWVVLVWNCEFFFFDHLYSTNGS